MELGNEDVWDEVAFELLEGLLLGGVLLESSTGLCFGEVGEGGDVVRVM